MNLFAQRRERFLEKMGPDAVAILPTNPVRNRSNDTDYRFRPDTDFYYLTGFPEPESVAILDPRSEEGPLTLVVRPRDPEKEVWNGRRAGVDGARERHGAHRAATTADLQAELARAIANKEKVYYRLGRQPEMDQLLLDTIRRISSQNRTGLTAPYAIVDPAEILAEMRLYKTPGELELARRAAEVSAAGHLEAMKAVRPGMYEYEIEALVEYTFRRAGCPAPGYTSIVGSGPNTCILHYHENDRKMEDGDLLLVDAGAEWECFSGDITRTYPVNGKFTKEQAAVYQIVLDAQVAAIAEVRPGNSFQAIHDTAVRVLAQGLIDLGLIDGPLEAALERESYRKYYMHKTSHWLGMDVHDAGRYRVKGEWRKLAPGMILTVEPGLYIGEFAPDAPANYRNVGVRIEDDVLVTENGHEVLTSAVPKTIAQIEAVMARR